MSEFPNPVRGDGSCFSGERPRLAVATIERDRFGEGAELTAREARALPRQHRSVGRRGDLLFFGMVYPEFR